MTTTCRAISDGETCHDRVAKWMKSEQVGHRPSYCVPCQVGESGEVPYLLDMHCEGCGKVGDIYRVRHANGFMCRKCHTRWIEIHTMPKDWLTDEETDTIFYHH